MLILNGFELFFYQVFESGIEAGEFVGGIDILFDDVEGEVVEAAEAPDHQGQIEQGVPRGIFEIENGGAGEANEEEKRGLEFHPDGVGEVFHGKFCALIISREGAAAW